MTMMRKIRARHIGGCCAALAWALAMPAMAQDAAPPPEPVPAEPVPAEPAATTTSSPAAQSAIEDIVVTGSRIANSGFTTPTPVTVLTNDRVETLAITNIGDALNQLPSFRAGTGPANQQTAAGNIGARLLDLRGLNPQRTLVLVDGRRFVPSTSQGTVDVNLIPSALVTRTDIVTGGASAAYGSDAVAGVVNFVLNRKLDGFRAEIIGGISERGDDASQFASIAGGTDIGSRVHVVFGGEYERTEGLGDCYSRDWCATQTLILGNTPAGTGGLPGNLIVPGVNISTMSPGGLINRSYNAAGQMIGTNATDPLRGTKFLADGTPAPFQYGTFVGPLFMLGGEGQGKNPFLSNFKLKVPTERFSTYFHGDAELTDTITASLDLSYGRVKGSMVSNVFRETNGSLFGRIKRDNPYIPTAIQDAMDANGVASFVLGRAGFDVGPSRATSKTSTFRSVFALEGKLTEKLRWDVSYQYGKTEFRQRAYNIINLANFPKAVDAVRNGAGQIVCRVNADAGTANDDPGCMPFNPFGEYNWSPAARDYITGNSFQDTDNDQHVVAANLQGELAELWAGPLTFAIGGEYRRDKISGTTDPVSLANGFFNLNGSAIDGKVSVKEAYAEVGLPLLRDSAVGHALDLNGAIRRTDYSTTGAVTTWKLGGVYEPIEAIRLRVTRSRDIRAPNLAELVGPRIKSSIGLTDPRNGLQTNPTVLTGSNPNLRVEKADSWTAGIVLAPRGGFLGRMRLSVDYYDIQVNDAIGTLGAQTLANGCFLNNVAEYCALITQGADGTITQVDDLNLNSAELTTSGFDVEFQYRQPLGGLGDLNLQVLANITKELTLAGVDRAGQNGVRSGTVPGIPDYTIDGLLTWTKGNFQLTGHGRYIPSGIFWTNFIGPDQEGYAVTVPTSVNNNRIPDRFYMDLSARITVDAGNDREFELFGTINNLFDRDPPIMPGGNGGTNQILYDPIGRAFKLGARVKFGA